MKLLHLGLCVPPALIPLAEAQGETFRVRVGDELRVTLELDWEGELGQISLGSSALDPYLRDVHVGFEGERTLVWRDRWLAIDGDGRPTSCRRTFERFTGSDTSRFWSLLVEDAGDLRVDLESPLAGLSCVARRAGGTWVPEWSDDVLAEVGEETLQRLAWDVGLEELIPAGRFVYLDGAACRQLLRPLGWPPWRPASGWSSPRNDLVELWGASPLGQPRLDDPRLVLRRRGVDRDDLRIEVDLEIREEIDLLADAANLGLDVPVMNDWIDGFDEAEYRIECTGRGELRWSRAHHRPSEANLSVDAELRLTLESGSGYDITALATGRLRQRMIWEPVPPQLDPKELPGHVDFDDEVGTGPSDT